MKQLFSAFLMVIISSTAVASADSYSSVTGAQCSNGDESLYIDLKAQTLNAEILDGAQLRSFSFDLLSKQDPTLKVEIIENIFESGYDVLGSVAMDTETFGTVGVLLDKPLSNPDYQEMTIVFIEAMTGRQLATPMICQFY